MATEADKVNDGALATLVAVGTFAMIGVCAFVTALVRHEMSSEAERKEAGADRELRDVSAAARAKLSAPPAWVDRGKGLVSLPIDRAKELVVGDLTRDPNSATPPPPPKEDAGAETAANVPDAGAESTDAGATPEAGEAALGAAQPGSPPGEQHAQKPAEPPPVHAQAPTPKPAPVAPAAAAPAPPPASAPPSPPAAPASVATP